MIESDTASSTGIYTQAKVLEIICLSQESRDYATTRGSWDSN